MSDIKVDVWPAEETEGFVLGKKLNTVIHGRKGGHPACPHCHATGPMTVFEFGVRWACGCIRPLPLLSETRREIVKLTRQVRGRRAA